jgi:ferric-dicitrate binding protein FerR (iron transport regulator)
MSPRDREDTIDENNIHMRIQALVDNELPEEDIEPTLERIQGSYEHREEYAALLRLKRRLADQREPPVSDDWVEKAEQRISRRLGRGLGTTLFLGSYLILLGYAVFTMFNDPGVPLIVAVLVSTILMGAALLLGNAIADRVREVKTDRYRRIIR